MGTAGSKRIFLSLSLSLAGELFVILFLSLECVCTSFSIDMASVELCAVIKVKPLRFKLAPLGGML